MLLLVAVAAAGCRPSAPSDFKASQAAFQKISRVKVEWTAQTSDGSFQQTAELDCAAPYYHRHIVKDLTARGIAADTREALGKPLSHQDTEYLFVDGRSYEHSTGQFGYDAKPGWVRSMGNYNPKPGCESLQAGKDPEDGPFAVDVHFFPVLDFARILSDNRMEYVADRLSDDGPCREYKVNYQSPVQTGHTATSNGTYSSFELKPQNAVVCLGREDRLPKQVVQGDWTVKYSYGEIDKMPAPQVAAN
jgi:hypothetical protein